MDRRVLERMLVLAAALLPAGAAGEALAQAGWPSRPVRLLVPAQPGGSTDTLARIAGQKLGDALGQPFVIDNRSGAGGTVAAETLMRSAPDGHTLGVAYTALTVNAVLQKVPYDTLRDFTPISLISTSPLVLVVGANSQVRTLKDLIQLAKAKPLSYGSAGIGSGGHVCGELLNVMAGIRTVHIPYKGAGPASADVAAGQIEFQFGAQITTQGLVKAGRLRMVAVTGARRAATLPDVPTMAESGLPGFEFNNWFGVLGPAGMPPAVVARLNAEMLKMMALPDVRERITFDGGEPAAGPPAEFRALLASDLSKWARIARELRMQAN
ncbi:MAG: tripartite tricarboxylate transporter substrate binding protein [Betaproteobacteria bacterium]|jgi:tripartite-type tricarboxylate transporter receptor subunit TctC|nr:tripartite tricarboxylate transporter substrate binding protein [Betaproteobacteria bacterium]